MDKYRKVIKPKDINLEKEEEEIRVTAVGSVSAYVGRAAKVYNELNKTKVVIKASGNALTKAVTLGEVIKRRFKDLHQVTVLGSVEIVDEYEPLEEGLEKVTDTRNVSTIEITLSKETLDSSDKGYQAPLDASLVTEVDMEEMMKPRGRGRGKGSGKGESKGKGKSKGKGTGKGKGDQSPDKGKGKSKGKGKAKGKDKGDDSPKGKGKAKGKSKDEPKGKGKGKGKGRYESYDYSPPRKGAGKSSGYGYNSYDSGYGYNSGYDSYGGGKGGKKGGKGGNFSNWDNRGDSSGYGSSYGKSKGKGKSSSWY